jgi:arylsulfatase A
VSEGWATRRLKNDTANFKDMVEYMDTIVGRLLDSLDKLGVLDNTLVLFTGDNGTPREITSRMGDRLIRGGKGLPTDAGTHVPMLALWRGTTPKGKVCEDLIDTTDFLPTMLEAAGVQPSRALSPGETPLDGRSFLPQLRGRTGRPRDWIYCWHDPRPGWDKDKYKLEEWVRNKRFKLYRDGRLFDVPADPDEQRPVPPGADPQADAARRALQPVLDRMKRGK